MQLIRGGAGVVAMGALVALVAPQGLRADVTDLGYTIIDLGTLGGAISHARAINNNGQVVGYSSTTDGYRAFLYEDGAMRDLGTLGGQHSSAYDINDAGQVVGSANTPGGESHAFLWSDGVMQDLGTLGGDDSEAYGINARGQVVGVSTTAEGIQLPFLWSDGVMTSLSTVSRRFGPPMRINEEGVVVGYSGDKTGGMSPANDINNSGVIVGRRGRSAPHWVGLIYDAAMYREGQTTFLGLLPEFNQGEATAINESCQIVGIVQEVFGPGLMGSYAPFLWKDGVMVDLNDLLVAPGSLRISVPEDINDLGQIVGKGGSALTSHAVLLTPVPEPASLAVLAGAAAGLLRRRRTWKRAGRRGP